MTHDLKSWADWYVSCSGGNIPNEAEAAYDAIAKIARLQAEVERTNDVLESQAHVIIDLRAKLITAHNDAIDAAASLCDLLSRATIDDGPLRRSAERCRDGVLALKR